MASVFDSFNSRYRDANHACVFGQERAQNRCEGSQRRPIAGCRPHRHDNGSRAWRKHPRVQRSTPRKGEGLKHCPVQLHVSVA